LKFEQLKRFLKWYGKTANVNEEQRLWRSEFGTPPPKGATASRLRAKF